MTPIYSNGVNQSSGVSDGLAGTIVDAKGDLVGASAADTPARVAVGANGKVLTADSAATAGVSYQYLGHGRSAGRMSYNAWTGDPYIVGGPASGWTDQQLQLVAMYVPTAVTMTNIDWCQTVQGSYTADNENRIGIYTSDGTDLTLVASTANDNNLWAGAVGIQRKAFSTPYAAAAGWYWVGSIWSNSAVTTSPTALSVYSVPAGKGFFTNAGDIGTLTLSAQTSLPATVSIAACSLGSTTTMKWFATS